MSQAYLSLEGNTSSQPAHKALLRHRLETSWVANTGRGKISIWGLKINLAPHHHEVQNCSPNVDVMVMPALPFGHWEGHFSRHRVDRQLCTPGLSDGDSYNGQGCSRSRGVCPIPSHPRQVANPGHQPTPMLFLELGALVCGSDLPGEGSSLLTRIGHEVWALPGSKHTSLV